MSLPTSSPVRSEVSGSSAASVSPPAKIPEHLLHDNPPRIGSREDSLAHQLHIQQQRTDALRSQLMESHRELQRLREVEHLSAEPDPSVAEVQSRLLREAHAVVAELREDAVQLQRENAELRRQLQEKESESTAVRLQGELEAVVEKQKKESKEMRYKLLRGHQDRQRLTDRVAELEKELDAARRAQASPRGAVENADKVDLEHRVMMLEAALEVCRQENASLRHQRLLAVSSDFERLHAKNRMLELKDDDAKVGEITRLQETLLNTEQQLDGAVEELAAAKQRIAELQAKVESQGDALKRREEEYEALLGSRTAELEAIGLLSSSLSETKNMYQQTQAEILRLQDINRTLAADLAVATESAKGTGPSYSLSEAKSPTKDVVSVQEELALVKKTASNAISTLSASLKKALLQSQEQARAFEENRLQLRGKNDHLSHTVASLEEKCKELAEEIKTLQGAVKVRDEEIGQHRRAMEQQQLRSKQAKQRLKAEILGTRQLIRSQQEHILNYDELPSSPTLQALASLTSSPTVSGVQISRSGSHEAGGDGEESSNNNRSKGGRPQRREYSHACDRGIRVQSTDSLTTRGSHRGSLASERSQSTGAKGGAPLRRFQTR